MTTKLETQERCLPFSSVLFEGLKPRPKYQLTRLGDFVGNIARPILAILEIDLSLAGPLHGDGEISRACFASPHIELIDHVLLSSFQTGATTMHPVGSAVLQGTDLNSADMRRSQFGAEKFLLSSFPSKFCHDVEGAMVILWEFSRQHNPIGV